MTAATKPNLGLTEGWAPGDSGWGDPMNANLDLLDAIVMLGVISATTLAPPTDPAPAEGDRYIIPTGATGDWSTHIGAVALFQDAAWVYLVPKVGWTARVAGGSRLDFNGTEWIDGGSIQEAPEDGSSYARKNGDWIAIGSGGGLPEAPEDGKQYARQDGAWAEVAAAASTLHALTDVDDSGKAQAVVLTYDTTAEKWVARLIALGTLVSYVNFGWDKTNAATGVTFSTDGQDATIPHGGFKNVRGLTALTSKTYWEVKVLALGTYFGMSNTIGLGDAASDTTSGPAMYNNGGQLAGFALSLVDGTTYENGNQWDTAPTAAVGDVFGFAYDPAARKIWYRKNGGAWNAARSTAGGDPATGANGITISYTMPMIPMAYCQDASTDAQYEINNGQLPWSATPPTGFVGSATTATAPSLGLADVTISAVADGDVLTYDAATKKFINKAPTGGGGGGSLATLSDVSLGTKVNHDLLVYKSTSTDWVNAQLLLSAPVAVTPAWDAANKSAQMALSNSNATATGNGNTTWVAAFGTQALTYKAYFELFVENGPQGVYEDFGLGVAAHALGLTTEAPAGDNNVVVGMYTAGPGGFGNFMFANGTKQADGPGNIATNTLVCVAYDPITRKVWIRVGATGTWNDSVGSQDPATGAGGLVVNGTDPVYPYYGNLNNSIAVTVRHSGFTGAVPAGFVGLSSPEYATPGDVNISSPTDGQVMQYDAASGTWKNKTILQGNPNKIKYGAHAYWRLNISANYGSNTSQRCSELRFFDLNGNQIPTTGGTAIGTAPFSSGTALAYAFDGDPTTFYRSNGAPEVTAIQLGYQFTTPQTVAEISYQISSDNILAGAKNFTVQYSDDGSAWTTAWTVAGVASNPYVVDTPILFTSPDLVLGTALAALSDVNLSTLTDGQAIVWDAVQGKFKNGTVASSGGGSSGNYNTPYKGASALGTGQTVVATTSTRISMGAAAEFDSDGFYSPGTPTRFTIPAGKGIQKVSLHANINASSGFTNGQTFSLWFAKNGTPIGGSQLQTGAYNNPYFSIDTGTITCADGDYFELFYYSSAAGGVINATSSVKIEVKELSSATNPPYDIPMFFPGIPANSQRMARIRVARPVAISKTAAHLADADAAATAAVSMPLKQNGSAIGTITFAAGSATGAINFTNDVALAAGDTLTWDNQAAADATLGNISATILGTRTA